MQPNQTVNGTSARKSVNLLWGDAYSQIEFVFSREDYPNTCKVTEITVENANIIKTATLNLATGRLYTGNSGEGQLLDKCGKTRRWYCGS